MSVLKGVAFINSLDEPKRKKLNKYLRELCDAATYQMSDKRYEWGIEEFIAGELGVPMPYNEDPDGDTATGVELTDAQIDEREDAMYEAHQAVIDEFTRTFVRGLK